MCHFSVGLCVNMDLSWKCGLFALLYRMVSLTELDVSSNTLEELPIGIGLLRHLRTLYADDNFLTYLPAEVTRVCSCCAFLMKVILHPLNGLLSRTDWVSWHQKGRTIVDFNEARDDGVIVASDGPYANLLHLAPDR